jgi:hypothetical protein
VPLPNIFLTRLFSKSRLKKKDFQEIARLAWAQEVPSSNLARPDHLLLCFQWRRLVWTPPLGMAAVVIIATQVLGDLASIFMGHFVRSGNAA